MGAEFTTETRAALFLQALGCCEVCGLGLMPGEWQAHHRQKRRHGRGDVANGLVVCAVSHDWIHKHEKAARALGYIVDSFADPSSVSIRWADHTWRTPVGRQVVTA